MTERVFVKCEGETIRMISFMNFDPCLTYGGSPREFLYRLPDDDPRPCGRHCSAHDDDEWFRRLPERQWVEIV